jgi:hypothetical protein
MARFRRSTLHGRIVVICGVLVASLFVTASGQATPAGKEAKSSHGVTSARAGCTARPGEYSAAYLRSVYRALWSVANTAGVEFDQSARAVDLDLSTGEEELAALIEDHFGDAVHLSVAGAAYCHGPGRTPACPLLTHDALPKGLHLSLRLKYRFIEPTEAVAGTLTVRWTGPGTFKMDVGQPLTADTLRPGTLKVRGTFTGSIAGTGLALHLTRGQSGRVPVFVGTTRCGARGSALSAGRYDVRVLLESEDRNDHRRYLSSPASLEVDGPPS